MTTTGAGGDATSSRMFGLDLHDPVQRATVESQIEALPGTIAARVVPGYDRPIDELHILVSPDRHPKHVVRDTQSLLYTRFDINVDHRVISVVRIEHNDPIAIATTGVARIRLTTTTVTQHPRDLAVTVVVTDEDDEEYVGTAAGEISPSGQRLATAEATLASIHNRLADELAVTIKAVDVISQGGHDVALAVMDVRAHRSSVTTAGSSVVTRGEIEAVARAVLDGLNRLMDSPQR